MTPPPTSQICPLCQSPMTDGIAGYCAACLAATAFFGEEEEGDGIAPSQTAPWSLGAYTLHEELGRGGMGVVYRATQEGLERDVALKVIPAGPLADPELVRRFRAEAKAAASLRHPHLVAVHEVGEADGHAFFSMDFIGGPTLSQRVRGKGPLPPRVAAACLGKVAAAVQHAHEHRLLHRDIKPSNILLDAEGEPHLADFGLAKGVAELDEAELTLSRQTVGTPGYVAPEQTMAKAALSPRTDIYGLGAVLYFALTGRPPFPAKDMAELLRQVRESEPSAPRLIDPDIPRDLETICLKALEKNPARRYSSARELAEDLERFLAGEPILARPLGRLGKSWRWILRNRALSAALAGMFAVLSAGALATTVLWFRAQRAAEAEAAQRISAETDLWTSLVASAKNERYSGLAGASQRALAAIRRAAEIQVTPEVRDEAIAALAMPDIVLDKAVSWKALPFDLIKDPVFSPSLDCAATIDSAGRRFLLNSADGSLRCELKGIQSSPAEGFWFSPSGRYIQAIDAQKHTILTWHCADGTPVHLPAISEPEWAVWNADETVLAILNASRAEFLAMPEGRSLRQISIPSGWKGPALNRDATCLAVGSGNTVHIVDAKTGVELKRCNHPDTIEWASWNETGSLLAVGCWNWRIYIWDAASGTLLSDCNGHDNRPVHQQFLPASDLLLSSSWDHTARLWDAPSGRPLLTLTGDEYSPINSSGGKLASLLRWPVIQFASVKTSEVLWRQREPFAVGEDASGVQSLAWSRDGSLIFTAGGPGGINAWETKTMRHLLRIPGSCVAVLPLPDSSLVFTGKEGARKLRWSSNDDGTVQRFSDPESFGPRVFANHAGCSADGSVCVFSTVHPATPAGQEIEVWRNGRFTKTWQIGSSWPPISVSPNGEFVAAGGFGPCQLRVFRTADGQTMKLEGTAEEFLDPSSLDCAFSPDGNFVAAEGALHVSLWHIRTGERRFRLPRPPGALDRIVTFSPDGRLLAAAGVRRDVWIIDASSGERITSLTFPGASVLADIAFSPDGRRLAIALANRQIILWDLERLRQALHSLNISSGGL